MIKRAMRAAIAVTLFYLFGVFVAQDWQWVMAYDSCCGGGVDRVMFAMMFLFIGFISWFFDKYKEADLSE